MLISANNLNIPSALTPKSYVSHQATEVAQSGQAVQAIDDVLDLTQGPRDLIGSLVNLSHEEQEQFLQMLARLLQHGIIGTETLEVDGQPRKTFVSTRIADPQLRHAKPYRNQHRAPSRLDLRG